jgi:S1-C subfamily serine protease
MNIQQPTMCDKRRFVISGKLFSFVSLMIFVGIISPAHGANIKQVIHETQTKMVKIYGAGGYKGLEAYQSGFLISSEGHILTVYSYVFESDYITATLDDGRKYEAKMIGADPKLEVAVLKIDTQEVSLPHFDVAKSPKADAGASVLAFSNLYGVATGDEPVSVQRGIVSAVTKLEARRGGYDTLYNGTVYVIDAMTNNPGAAGGALVNRHGEILGLLGKELRNSRNNIWLNYAMPIAELTDAIDKIKAGKAPLLAGDKPDVKLANPMTLKALGIVLVPNVLERTPPYIDSIREKSPAAKAGLKVDDRIMFVDDQLVRSCQEFTRMLERIEIDTPIKLTVLREDKQEQQLIMFSIQIEENRDSRKSE